MGRVKKLDSAVFYRRSAHVDDYGRLIGNPMFAGELILSRRPREVFSDC